MPDQPAQDQAIGESTLPDVWVRAHPFSDGKTKDAHREYFSPRTKFYDDLLPHVPVTYFHSHTPQGAWAPEPIVIGRTTARQYRNDGRWDKVHFFDKDKIPQDIFERLDESIKDGTFRSSPTVVPDIHVVKDDGHIEHWATGSIAVFDAKQNRRPANWNAIGATELKSLFKAADLDFPNLQGVNMAQADTQKPNLAQSLVDKIKELYQAAMQGSHSDEWTEFFGEEDSAATDETAVTKADGDATSAAKETTMADKPNDTQADDLRLQFEKQGAEMKAVLASNLALQARLDRADIEKWIDGTVNAQGIKVPPAEREQVVTLALNLKGASNPTMKSADGADTTAFDAFKQTIEAREVKIPLDGKDLNYLKFDNGKKEDNTVTPERKKQLLEMTELGRQTLAEASGAK